MFSKLVILINSSLKKIRKRESVSACVWSFVEIWVASTESYNEYINIDALNVS